MNLALLYPEVYDIARFREERKEFPPFGVLYLAAILREDGFDVQLLAVRDQESLDLRGFDAIGVSVASSATVNLLASALRTAQLADHTPVVAGGVHATFYPDETLHDLNADVVCFDEADLTIANIFTAAISGGDYSHIPGLIYRTSEGTIRRTGEPTAIADVNALPHPARDLLPQGDVVMSDRLAGTDTDIAHVMFSRGCPFPCAFCAAGNSEIRYRSGESAKSELEGLVEAYGIGGFAVVDDNFIVRKRAVAEIAQAIEPLGLKWSALSRVDTVNDDLLQLLASSGCVEIKYGIESGSESLLRKMRKNTTRERIVRSVRQTSAAGIGVKAFIIHGYPGENLETTRETISLLEELKSDINRVSLFRFVPLPGTEAYQRFLELGIKGTHLDRRRWDGDWSKFHIHHNDRHWWGTAEDFDELQRAFAEIESFVTATFGTA